jgi:hypothetical protein
MGDKRPYEQVKRYQAQHINIVIRGPHIFTFALAEQFSIRETVELKVFTDKTFVDMNYCVTLNATTKSGGHFDHRYWVRDRAPESFVICIENIGGVSVIADLNIAVMGVVASEV